MTTVPLNWHVKIVCRDCGSIYDVQRSRVDCSVDRLPAGQRMLLLTVPNECPDCHNLHVVPKENT
jgi:ribosomal protein S27E